MKTEVSTGEQLKVRVKTPLYDWVKNQAREQERSITWVVNKMLQQAKEAQSAKTAA